MTDKLNVTLGEVMGMSPTGDPNYAIGQTLYGLNHRSVSLAVPHSKEQVGLVLFTRPQLNLTDQNIRALRELTPLLTTEPRSIQRMVRKLLDPRMDYLPCPFVDQRNPFIPILTNHCLSVSGWPDPYVNSYISKPGAYKETFGMVDDIYRVYGDYPLTATFRNMPGDPISTIFDTWNHYSSNVFTEPLIPYPDHIVEKRIDYNTAIWRLVLDRNKRYVTRIARTGAAYPRGLTVGALFDFSSDEQLIGNSKTITVPFQAFGAIYNDPLLVHIFNFLVGMFNTSMYDEDTEEPTEAMTQIPFPELNYFNGVGYPRIDPETYELQFWLPVDEYNHRKDELLRITQSLGQSQ